MERTRLEHALQTYPLFGHILTEAYQQVHEVKMMLAEGSRPMFHETEMTIREFVQQSGYDGSAFDLLDIWHLQSLGLIRMHPLVAHNGDLHWSFSLTDTGKNAFEENADLFEQYRKPHHNYRLL